jgi:small subunit ribosomal protein S20
MIVAREKRPALLRNVFFSVDIAVSLLIFSVRLEFEIKEIQLPTHKSAEKRMKTAEKARQRNRRVKSLVRGAIKDLAAEKDDAKKAEKLKKATSILDKAARKRVISKNKAARAKSGLAKSVKK